MLTDVNQLTQVNTGVNMMLTALQPCISMVFTYLVNKKKVKHKHFDFITKKFFPYPPDARKGIKTALLN